MKLSVVLATRNEESNIKRCLQSIHKIADEIIIFDEHSSDATVQIARSFGATVYTVEHAENFHITKQKAIEKAKGDWILQLDADEVVTSQLAKEIRSVIGLSNKEIIGRKPSNSDDEALFKRHLEILHARDGVIGTTTSEVVAFLIPRINMFLGYPLKYGGVYPDGVIRLIKKGKAFLPGKSVHEQMVVNGQLSWLFNPLEHWDSPTLERYITRLNRYTELHAADLDNHNVNRDTFTLLRFITFEPTKAFLIRYIRHKGYLDGLYGFIWALFSAWHFPIAYFKYATRHR